MGTQLPLPELANPPILGPYLLRPNGCMDQDATLYGGKPRPRRPCIRWGPRSPSPKRGGTPKFSAHDYCGQTAGWIKMVLGMEVGLSPGDFVLDGDPAPSKFSAHVYYGYCDFVRTLHMHKTLFFCSSSSSSSSLVFYAFYF